MEETIPKIVVKRIGIKIDKGDKKSFLSAKSNCPLMDSKNAENKDKTIINLLYLSCNMFTSL